MLELSETSVLSGTHGNSTKNSLGFVFVNFLAHFFDECHYTQALLVTICRYVSDVCCYPRVLYDRRLF